MAFLCYWACDGAKVSTARIFIERYSELHQHEIIEDLGSRVGLLPGRSGMKERTAQILNRPLVLYSI